MRLAIFSFLLLLLVGCQQPWQQVNQGSEHEGQKRSLDGERKMQTNRGNGFLNLSKDGTLIFAWWVDFDGKNIGAVERLLTWTDEQRPSGAASGPGLQANITAEKGGASGISFASLGQKYANSGWYGVAAVLMGIILAVMGWKLGGKHKYVMIGVGLLVAALGNIIVLDPALAVKGSITIAVLVLVAMAWHFYFAEKLRRQLVTGVQRAKDELSPAAVGILTDNLAKAQDEDVRAAVSRTRANMPDTVHVSSSVDTTSVEVPPSDKK